MKPLALAPLLAAGALAAAPEPVNDTFVPCAKQKLPYCCPEDGDQTSGLCRSTGRSPQSPEDFDDICRSLVLPSSRCCENPNQAGGIIPSFFHLFGLHSKVRDSCETRLE
ncbi:hypothetical protein CDD83_3074 [Cordyceps sp. RAO-2017]|nr:hypothetical protein CDD83_3074 [Cordyceps sp. RAO-2017]